MSLWPRARDYCKFTQVTQYYAALEEEREFVLRKCETDDRRLQRAAFQAQRAFYLGLFALHLERGLLDLARARLAELGDDAVGEIQALRQSPQGYRSPNCTIRPLL